MPPPYERFGASDASGGEVDLWLPEDDELVVVDGLAKALFAIESIAGPSVELIVVDRGRAPAILFGSDNSCVSFIDELERRGSSPTHRDADRDGRRQRCVGNIHRLADRATNALCNRTRVGELMETVEDHDELVSAEPDDMVGAHQLVSDAAGCCGDDGVACGVPE